MTMRATTTTAIPLLAALLAPLTAQRKVHFERQVLPILEKRCIECHRATYVDENGRRRRPKGRVMFDTRRNIEKSKRGKLFVAGDPDASLVIESITLPADDEDRMPPPKKGRPLSDREIQLIRSWIEQGADYGDWTGDGSPPPKKPAKSAGKSTRGGSPKAGRRRGPNPLVALAKGLRPAKPDQLAPFAREGSRFAVRSVGGQSPLLTVTCCGHTDEVDDRAVADLLAIKEHIYELDLARSNVGDDACAVIAQMPRLVKLDLRETAVGNAGVTQLGKLQELRTLNLFGTKVGDYAMQAIAGLKKLERLYVWQTDVSARAVTRLREKLPNLRIVFAPDLPEPMETGGNRR